MSWEEVKHSIFRSGLKHTILNKKGEYETVHVEKPDGNFILDIHLYKYEPHNWERHLKEIGINQSKQLDLFA